LNCRSRNASSGDRTGKELSGRSVARMAAISDELVIQVCFIKRKGLMIMGTVQLVWVKTSISRGIKVGRNEYERNKNSNGWNEIDIDQINK
jgi:hypothetical protein